MVGTFRVEPSGVVKGNIWVSTKENFFCHMLLKYRVLTRVTWLSDDPVFSNVIPCTSPSAQKRDKGGDTCSPTRPGLKARSMWLNKASWDHSPSLRPRDTTHKALLTLYLPLPTCTWTSLGSPMGPCSPQSWDWAGQCRGPKLCQDSADDSSPVPSTMLWP